MKLADKVASVIYEGHVQAVEQMPGVSVQDLYRLTRKTTVHNNPQQRISMCHSVAVGDIFQPLEVDVALVMSVPVAITPSMRFMVYQISCPVIDFNMTGKEYVSGNDQDVKTIVLIYEDAEDPLDLFNISSVLCSSSHTTLVSVLSRCKLVGNVADQLV